LAIVRDLADLRAAGRLLGVKLDLPEAAAPTSGTTFRQLQELVNRVSVPTSKPSNPTVLNLPSLKTAATADVVGIFGSPSLASVPTPPPPPSRPPIKDIVLDRLKTAGPKGSKAAPIRDHIERVYGEKIHEKTVGMTLYRLAKDGLVRREGRTWFLAQQAGSPGAVTPGPETEQT
jgi:hypothetical protein